MRNNHVKTMKKYIEQIMSFGECHITHKDILRETNANCCYSVLKSLKHYYDIDEKWIDKENCRFKEYTLKRKDKLWEENQSSEKQPAYVQLGFTLGKNS